MLRLEVAGAQRLAFAEGTLNNLRSQCKAFILFCLAYDIPPFPASLDTILCYATFLSRSLTPASTRNYIGGVKLIHVLARWEFPHTQHIEFRLLSKGLAKQNPHIQVHKLPITPSILMDMFRVMNMSSSLHITLWCSFVLVFSLFFRKDSLVPKSAAAFRSDKHLCRRDIILDSHQVLVYVKSSKTLQCRDRYLLIPLVEVPGSPLCPVSAVRTMFTTIPANPVGPAFVVPGPQGLQTLTHYTFTKHLRSLLHQAGHNPSRYSGHSFRRGGASFALASGVPGELIKTHGDWRSQAYLRYLDSSVQQRELVSRMMARACIR